MTVGRDLRYAFRILARSRTVTIVAILTLAIGVGLNTAIFSVLESVILRQLPYPAASRLVTLWQVDDAGRRQDRVNLWRMLQWRSRSRAIDSVALYGDSQYTLQDGGQAEVLRGMRVSASFFDTIGVRMALGRGFAPGEDRSPHEPVIVLGNDVWRRRFGSDPGIVGRVLNLTGRPTRVIGVLPASFHPIHMSNPAEVPQVFTTADYDPLEIERCHPCARDGFVIARVTSSGDPSGVSAELTEIDRELARQYPKDGWRYTAVGAEPLLERLVGPVRRSLWIVFGAVFFVLLIACANVAGIQLARASGRTREFAVRSALGGSRRQLIVQTLVENLLLALAGGAAGAMTAPFVVSILVARAPRELPRLEDVRVDGTVLGFALATTIVTGLVFGMIPAMTATRVDLNDVMKRTTGFTGRTAGSRLRRAVVVIAVALSFVLVAGTGLIGRSLGNLAAVAAGFDGRNVLTLTPGGDYSTPEARVNYLRTLVQRVEAVPGVEAAGLISNVPLSHVEPWPFTIVGRPPAGSDAAPNADVFWVSPGYFRALRVPLRRGRALQDHDGDPNGPHGVLVSETFARLHFPNADPIGQRIQIWPDDPQLQIVGVAGDVRYSGLDRLPGAAVYVPLGIDAWHYMRLVARTAGEPLQFERSVRAAIHDIDPAQPVFHVQPMEDYVAASLADRRFAFALIASFGSVALLLAAIGVYGLVSYTVIQRTAEIGVRTALGAMPGDVLRLVLRQGMTVAALGLASGAVIALASLRLMAALLFGVSSSSLSVFAGTALTLLLAAALASYIPARAAARLEPVAALRVD